MTINEKPPIARGLFDAHTHIHFPAYNQDRDETIKRARAAGVKMIAVGTNLETSISAIELAKKYPDDIWATVGFHPSHVQLTTSQVVNYWDKNESREPVQDSFSVEKFRYLATHPKAVAIGECGLDYYRLSANRESQIAEQKKVFLEQIKLAEDLQKPLMIHCRPSKGTDDAYKDLLNILKTKNYKLKTLAHFFVGSLNVAKKLLELGCYFTFGGVITFTRDYDEVIKYLPLENILLETDAPYVAPVPYRGQRNEPAYVIEVAKKMAVIKNLEFDAFVDKTTENTKRIFAL